MSMQLGTSNGPRCEINVTPMIDLLLVLIIIFMLVTTHTQGLKAELPQKGNPPQKTSSAETSVILQIKHDPLGMMVVRINQDDVRWEELEKRLEGIYKNRADKVLFISAANDIEYEYVAHAIDIANGAVPGIRVGLAPADLPSMGGV